jgi:hypothetical protein
VALDDARTPVELLRERRMTKEAKKNDSEHRCGHPRFLRVPVRKKVSAPAVNKPLTR